MPEIREGRRNKCPSRRNRDTERITLCISRRPYSKAQSRRVEKHESKARMNEYLLRNVVMVRNTMAVKKLTKKTFV